MYKEPEMGREEGATETQPREGQREGPLSPGEQICTRVCAASYCILPMTRAPAGQSQSGDVQYYRLLNLKAEHKLNDFSLVSFF